ncbi:ATP-binding protein [Traorella massiliensis]|uniref:ATP-binding protein n=1 Tax=Traorella massiliensis TaxID=1903263 RepID=UPI002356B698|nr:sensor histidine kinase [Traorella massiliensis]
MQNTENTIYFNFSYFALQLLGKGLYSNHWTAIAELVANGLDAQAESVKIYINMIDKKYSSIEIFDNGNGMNYHELAEKYVLIGKDKREDDEISDEIKQQLMGRKGIGKLAALYLSNKYFLVTKKKNEPETAWCLDASMVKNSDIPHLDRCDVSDINIECSNEWNNLKKGTMIKLTNVDLTNFGAKTLEGFKARLADFYLTDSLAGSIEVCVIDREGQDICFEKVEKSIAFKNFYAFYNNSDIPFEKKLSSGVRISASVDVVSEKLRPVVVADPSNFKVSGKKKFLKPDGTYTEKELEYCMIGWIGIHTSIKKEEAEKNDPDYLKNKAYRPNQLRLYVRKKLAVENFLDYVKNTQAFSNYIEGEISFDILDDNELGDIATSNRQGFVEDDERVILLIEILKPIINYLIRSRVKIAAQISEEIDLYYTEQEQKLQREKEKAEEKRKEEENKRIKAEEEKRREEQRREEAENHLEAEKNRADALDFNLTSERKRNSFLVDTLDEGQIDFAKRLHMLKINSTTISKTITKNIMKLQRGKFTEDDAWACLKRISYLNSRMQAVLAYSPLANFNTKEEYTTGDVLVFIEEYCKNILGKNEDIDIIIKKMDGVECITRFVPQDIVVVIENITSNSKKHFSRTLTIDMKADNENIIIDFIDDGNGVDPKIKNFDELFEFGKGYTSTGSGIGLYHVKDIIENKMKGKVSVASVPGEGFTLQVRLKK